LWLELEGLQNLSGNFTFVSGATKEEWNEIVRQSIALWDGERNGEP